MKRKPTHHPHDTLLPSLTEALERIREKPAGMPSGLAGPGLDAGVPELSEPHEVSHQHPFTPERDED